MWGIEKIDKIPAGCIDKLTKVKEKNQLLPRWENN